MAATTKLCCDVCGRGVKPSEIRTINDAYACDGLVDVCDVCWPWVCHVIAQEKAKLAANVRSRINERAQELKKYREVERVALQKHQAAQDAERSSPLLRRFLLGIFDL